MAGYDPGSFRDPESRVFTTQGCIYRGLSESALGDWKALASTEFFRQAVADGKIIGSNRVPLEDLPPILTGSVDEWAAILKHETIPFISYPYEWCFGMLKDAGLLQLDLLLSALDEGLILKDSSAFNFQWWGARPVLIDVGSFKRFQSGEPWEGYRQFCQMFLYPLQLQAYKGVAFQPWLRGDLDGISPAEMNRLMTKRDLVRPGVLLHVYAQTRLQQRFGSTDRAIRIDLTKGGFDVGMIRANVTRMQKLVQQLEWKPKQSEWSEYQRDQSYSQEDSQTKERFVREVLGQRQRHLVWDLGCNTGYYSELAAEHSEYVVAMDADQLAIERLYARLRAGKNANILPLVMNLAQPSGDLGWAGVERQRLDRRGTPDLTLCLALVHHLALGATIPLREIIRFLATFSQEVVIEFPTREDPMVKKLLLHKSQKHEQYNLQEFERRLEESFSILGTALPLASGTRTLYHVRARN